VDEARGHHRSDVEGLRGIAILMVLAFHAEVPWMPGGLFGVDVFFVISGFVISGQLLRSLQERRPRLLADFYIRRIRRILPLAATVIGATLLASWVLLPPLRRADVARDAVAGLLDVSNWWFLAQGTNYLTAERDVSPLLHYWSLGVEEQFYVVWPIVLMVAWALLRRRHARPSHVLGGIIAAVAVSSFVAALALAQQHPQQVFYASPLRGWQFALGALVAVATLGAPARVAGEAARGRPPRWWTAAGRGRGRSAAAIGMAAVGLAALAVVVASSLLDERGRHPVLATAVPTLAAVAVIAEGSRGARSAAARVLSVSPLTWLGRISFGLYLWHWPLLVLTATAVGPLSWPVKVVLVAVAVALARVTVTAIEDPIRYGRRFTGSRRLSLAGGLVPTCTVLVLAVLVAFLGAARAGQGQPSVPGQAAGAASSALGPFAAGPVGGPPGTAVAPGDVIPSGQPARHDISARMLGCQVDQPVTVSPTCTFGDVTQGHVVLLGDSHASQWIDAVQMLAAADHQGIELLLKGGCPLPQITVVPPGLGRPFTECDTWRSHVLDRLAAEPKPAAIYVAADNWYITQDDVLAGWQKVLSRLVRFGASIVYLRDTPRMGIDVPACMSGATRIEDCSVPRSRALRPDPLAEAILQGRLPVLVRMIDVNPLLCPPGPSSCPAALGTTLLYRDESHLTNTAVLKLLPTLRAALAATRGH
jgi:peptidoglycan/LPS O-acetylase OafA/YrhL